ncbi:GTPase HflX [Roseburia sp. 499]|uniref:GTPase HflX n=1 Tax=Roseburia sp. 499 TaxID=1261634 RepID=UPI000952DE5B|nr:GTPase HflX [Roseburia sp. 499]WVK69126.1 GTPase HflX [Roseburia sp. 499]
MKEPFKIEEVEEKVILVGVSLSDGDDAEDSLLELAELVKTAGAEVVGTAIQSRDSIHPGTYVGKGKLQEIRQMIIEFGATGIVCDDELSPAQIRNMEDELDTKVMDRTLIILDIFAARASTSEGKIQVELAQLKYRLSRLTGLGISLSRLGGGIGTRGPGEKKLEMDRRLIKNRIAQLNRELEEVRKHREVTRGQRSRNQTKVAAIVGYTNAGKSTLLNTMTNAQVLEEDKLFATLDPTTRNLKLDSGQEILLTDTVGFIRKLPHHLVEAFRSTLEEAKYADMIIHVVDASNPQKEKQMHIVYETLDMLGVKDKKIVTLFNKLDKVEENEILHDFKADKTLKISAKSGEGLTQFKEVLEEILREDKKLLEGIFPYNQGGQLTVIRKYGELLEEEYRENGIYVKAFVPIEIYSNLENSMNYSENIHSTENS